MKKIYVYIHICTVGVWRDVVKRLFDRIEQSGLLSECEGVRVTVLGSAKEVSTVLDHPKVEIIFHSRDTKIYERRCLLILREHALREDAYFLYLHSKGVTKPGRRQIVDWVELLTHFTVDRYKMCVEELRIADTVGVNLNRTPSLHYSGNFWWARSEHLRRLPESIGHRYIDPEMWIGCARGSAMVCLWHSGISHYKYQYPCSKYFGKIERAVRRT
jgi:hypothetical protein